MKENRILLVDDDRHLLGSMIDWLRELGYKTDGASSLGEAMTAVDRVDYDLIITDIRLGPDDGFELLEHCRTNHPSVAVILITGYGTVESAIEAVRAGAFDFLTKPLIDQELQMAIERALKQQEVIEEIRVLKKQLDQTFALENIVGTDHRMRKIYDIVEAVADTKASVLITGESGTGKSLLARAIHRQSARRDRPFVEVACGALPESLLESELFGHKEGSFTGAISDKQGKFQAADGGTIFLDEIATATPALQVKLLRVLQDFEFEQIGSTDTISVDTRVILATNENLEKAVAAGTFRQDLYYRVNVINIELPPLRDRVSDIPLLAEHFLNKVREESGKPVECFSDEAMSALQSYAWPGNVRQLQNIIERSVLLSRNPKITLADLPKEFSSIEPNTIRPVAGRTLKEALEEPERRIILEVLELNGWNRQATADSLGINRTTLFKKMRRLGLDRNEPAPTS